MIETIAAFMIAANIETNVYVAQASGARYTICSKIFQIYDSVHKTKHNIIIKPGAEGTIAIKAMLSDPKPSILCGGIDVIAAGYDLKPALMYCSFPLSFWTSVKNKENNLEQMIKNPISIGYHLKSSKLLVEKMYPKANINWIPFKGPGEANYVLAQGDLDVYVDGGSLKTLADAGRIKSIGDFKPKSALSVKYPEIANTINFCGIMVKPEYKDRIKLHNELYKIVSSDYMIEQIESWNQIAIRPTIQESDKIVDRIKKLIDTK